MSTNSNDQGRAYEYAWINSLYKTLNKVRKTIIVDNSSLEANLRAWNAMDESMQNLFALSAKSAVDTILELEPKIDEKNDDTLFLEFQKDSAGTKGDVRDIIIRRNDIGWEIGLSIKHNHEAIKHSRLSHSLDWGKEWFSTPCSNAYWDAVKPIFERLKKEKEIGTKWSEIADKETVVYVPMLAAFMEELNRSYSSNPTLPQRMIQYLIGIHDYYKIVSHDNKRMTLIHTFNMNGTLNTPGKIKVSAISVPTIELPTEIIAIRHKTNSNNTVEMYLNSGWQLSFRIHNASTKVEPSLKFDIQFIGMPISILNIECSWR